MSAPNLEESLLALVSTLEYRPAKPRILAKQLRLSEEEAIELKRVIKRLMKSGRLVWGANHLVWDGDSTISASKPPKKPASEKRPFNKPAEEKTDREPTVSPPTRVEQSPDDSPFDEQPASEFTPHEEHHVEKKQHASKNPNRVSGLFRRAQGGFGFVRPTGMPPGSDRSFDIFIPQKKTLDAASGDTVLVRMKKESSRRDKREGEIVEILERDTHQFVGTYFERDGNGYVQVDGTVFQQPIYVGDPGAKNARDDDKVVFEMVRFPSQSHDGEGVISEVLGARGAPGVDTLSIIREFALPGEFPDDVLAESRIEAEQFDESLSGRLNLTAETIITIDPVDARDFDDAISLERLSNGHWRLGVHIADVSHFVKPKTPLDREAHNRATSVYLPDRVIPMLPEIISNNLASLQPDRVRYTKTCFIEFTADGAKVAADPHNSAIKSKRRFTYEEVDAFLKDREEWKKKLDPPVYGLLERMHELAMMLRARRMRRGSLELTMAEIKIDLDPDGRVSGAHRVENTESHQMIEEFMLAANEAVAEILRDHKLHFLRRVHQTPDPRKMKILTEFVGELGLQPGSLEDRFELQRLLKQVHGRPEEYAVNYAALRSLQRAIYSPIEEGHYALASECYCHFTSPIRRYPDLTIHRQLDAIMKGKKPPNDLTAMQILGEHCSDREHRSEAAERELTKVKLLHYLKERIGEEWDAIVTGVEEFGIFVQGMEIPAEGLIHISSLQDDSYRFDRKSHSLTGQKAGNIFRLGDVVRVSVFRVDIERRALDFRILRRSIFDEPSNKRFPSKKERRLQDLAKGKKKSGPRPEKKRPEKKRPKKHR